MVSIRQENIGPAHKLFNHIAEAPEYTQVLVYKNEVLIAQFFTPKAKLYANIFVRKRLYNEVNSYA